MDTKGYYPGQYVIYHENGKIYFIGDIWEDPRYGLVYILWSDDDNVNSVAATADEFSLY